MQRRERITGLPILKGRKMGMGFRKINRKMGQVKSEIRTERKAV